MTGTFLLVHPAPFLQPRKHSQTVTFKLSVMGGTEGEVFHLLTRLYFSLKPSRNEIWCFFVTFCLRSSLSSSVCQDLLEEIRFLRYKNMFWHVSQTWETSKHVGKHFSGVRCVFIALISIKGTVTNNQKQQQQQQLWEKPEEHVNSNENVLLAKSLQNTLGNNEIWPVSPLQQPWWDALCMWVWEQNKCIFYEAAPRMCLISI